MDKPVATPIDTQKPNEKSGSSHCFVPKNIKGVVGDDEGSDSDDSDMDGIDVEYLIKSAERVKRSADDTAKFLRSRSSHHKRKVKK